MIRRARKATEVMHWTEKKRVVVSRTVVEVSKNFHTSASNSMNPRRRARHAETLLMVVVAHFIFCCFHGTIAPSAWSEFGKEISVMQC